MVKPFRYIPLHRLPFKYLPPNFATAANMILGLLSIVFSVKGEFHTAAWLIILACFIDGIDGLLARLLKATSHFGIEFDSFSDFVSFGIAPPAMILCYIIYSDFVTADIVHLVWIAIISAIFYILMAAIRLSRFNVQTIELGQTLFHGIPSTASAGLIASLFLTLQKYGNPVKDPGDLIFLACATLFGFGILMVCTVPLLKLRPRKNRLVTTIQLVSLAFCFGLAVARRLPDVLLAAGVTYIVLGITFGVKAERAVKREKEQEVALEEESTK
ncbi:MAG: phosphatidylcholine/phosphatidylserine synthase [Pseudomonadota bacterium]